MELIRSEMSNRSDANGQSAGEVRAFVMADTKAIAEHCQANNAEGNQCGAKPRPGRPVCLWHDPEAAELRRELSRKGGQARSNKARARKSLPADPMTAAELHSYLGLVFKGVIAGKIEPGVGTATATIARTMVDLAREADLEQRITNLEHERTWRRPA